jgi:hypothetical protein
MDLFNLENIDRHWAVTWSEAEWRPVASLDGFNRLLQFAFNIDNDYGDIGFVAPDPDVSGKRIIHYFSKMIALQDPESIDNLASFLYNRYQVILGVSFTLQSSAELFKETLEKRYVWKILETP